MAEQLLITWARRQLNAYIKGERSDEWFESTSGCLMFCAPVAQWTRAVSFYLIGRRFESVSAYQVFRVGVPGERDRSCGLSINAVNLCNAQV